jgi:propanol-preferring alcohol dehydrogenase
MGEKGAPIFGNAQGEAPDLIGLFCWLHRPALLAALIGLIDSEADDDHALSLSEREVRLAEIARDKLMIERQECALIWLIWKAAVVRKFTEPLSIEETPVPEPGRGQILVKIEACGVCHTDLHAADGDWPVKPKPPFIPGHEGVGTVSAVGAGVSVVKEGDRVGVPWLHTACGHCRHCLAAWETLCDSQQNTGYSVNGGFAEYTLADPNYVGHLPKGLDFEPAAPILCAGVTVYKGLKETDAKPGDTVVISGIGGLGHVAVQYAKAMGLEVIAVDISDEKLSLARRMGADAAVNAKTTDPVAEVNKLCGGAQGVLVTAVSPKARCRTRSYRGSPMH